ncbi:DUF2306 domain-containing protein [Desertivirga xinjiangensis]|uniref:DUF2306 domain-containing protein n=1 Tax=Desertivirga xinjiangensis TaxID=539206 RepID=UPI002109E4B6|nr:DUF2306 domain-containing protein [Pedobacter xinjiangensis]
MRWKRFLWWIAFFWVVILSVSTLEYIDLKPDTGFLKLKQQAIASGWYLPAFHAHIFGSALILLAGSIQFLPLRKRYPKLHRVLGKLYVFGVLLFAVPGAYVMTFFIDRGTGVFTSFLLQNTLWIIFTMAAYLAVKKRQYEAHTRMMRRSYALAFAAVTLRFYIWLFTVLGNGVQFEHNYLIIALLSWIPNLLFVEYYNNSFSDCQTRSIQSISSFH